MNIGQARTPAETAVAAGTGFAVLVALAAASRAPTDELPGTLRDALGAVGDAEGEIWLNLFGVALDAGPPYDDARLLAALAGLDGVELRRHVLGRYAWSWCTLAGVEDLESAAAGDGSAAGRLLAHPRYYGGHAAASLAVVLALDSTETRERIVRAVEAGAQELVDRDVESALAEAEQEASATIASRPPLEAIELLATGYRYVPEPEAERVVLIPHLEPELPLVLAQHRSSRLIAYRAYGARGSEERLLGLGRALADPKRVEILALVSRGVGRASELVERTGLSRSTVHHHLAQLREVGLVGLEGNARAYTYVARRDAADEAAALVAQVMGGEERR
jgi:DNA-binding transcriptional ArsR family regulator